jgi:hypothetical protein
METMGHGQRNASKRFASASGLGSRNTVPAGVPDLAGRGRRSLCCCYAVATQPITLLRFSIASDRPKSLRPVFCLALLWTTCRETLDQTAPMACSHTNHTKIMSKGPNFRGASNDREIMMSHGPTAADALWACLLHSPITDSQPPNIILSSLMAPETAI